jgi:predicted nucleotide-binding protein
MNYNTKVELLNELIDFTNNYNQHDQPDAIKRHVQMVVKKVTGSNDYYSQINDIRFTPNMVAHNIPGFEDASITFYRQFQRGKQELINLIRTVILDIEIDFQINGKEKQYVHSQNPIDLKKVFIVHGHNEEIKWNVARTLEKLHLEAIILHEKPNKGRTIINKFTDYSDVDFAIVIISGDDYGYSKKDGEEKKQLRTRQNVIFELGFFIAKLGIDKVFVLVENSSIEKPGDFDGVVYIPYNSDWKHQLVQELKAAGYELDANRLFN